MALICDAVETHEGASRPSVSRQGGSKTIEEIVAEQDRRWKEPFGDTPRAVDMIREDRDAR